MVTLDLSRVDRKAQGPLEIVSYWSILVPLQATHKTQLERPNRPAQLDNQLVIKGETYIFFFLRESLLWSGVYVRVKPLDYSPLETDWETTLLGRKVELKWRLKVFPSTSNLLFWISPHQGMLSCSQILKIT